MSLKQRVFDCQKVIVDRKPYLDWQIREVVDELGRTILYLGGYIEQLETKIKELEGKVTTNPG